MEIGWKTECLVGTACLFGVLLAGTPLGGQEAPPPMATPMPARLDAGPAWCAGWNSAAAEGDARLARLVAILRAPATPATDVDRLVVAVVAALEAARVPRLVGPVDLTDGTRYDCAAPPR